MIDNDTAVARNFGRLAGQTLKDVFAGGPTTFDDYVEHSIGKVRDAIMDVFPNLQLNGLDDPLENGTFRFTKGNKRGIRLPQPFGGEKSVFDLVLDLVVASRRFDDTVFRIDEPEAHMNAALHGTLLSVLYNLLPDKCQMILATHSIGMMRCALDIQKSDPGSVVFLDFGQLDFDRPQVIEPTQPDTLFWKRQYEVALDDLASLVAPEEVVICEGEPRNRSNTKNYAHDSRCYERIFEKEFPRVGFVPGGNASEVESDKRGHSTCTRCTCPWHESHTTHR